MPEGDALYRFAAAVRAPLLGRVVRAAKAQGPGAVPRIDRIVGATCTGVESRGKNLLITFDNGLALRGHLRMHGTWHVYAPGERWRRPARAARLVIEVDGAVVVNFDAPVIELLEVRALDVHAPIAGLGPDLLDDDFDAARALQLLADPARADLTIGDAVMDQHVMAGAGNIWKHETLFRCGVNPWRRVGDLSGDELAAIVEQARTLLRASAGKPDATGRPRRPSMYVYGRAGQRCLRCGDRLQSGRQGVDIRFTTWCPTCQPLAPGQPPPPSGRRWAGGARPRHRRAAAD